MKKLRNFSRYIGTGAFRDFPVSNVTGKGFGEQIIPPEVIEAEKCVKAVWTQQELDLLKKGIDEGLNYDEIRTKYLPYRKYAALQRQAFRQGWKLKNSSKAWNQPDLDSLKQGIDEGLSCEEIVYTYLPHRTVRALSVQAFKQGWKFVNKLWLKNELFKLDLSLYKGLSLPEIQRQFFSSRTLIQLQARINVPDWNKDLYDGNINFNIKDIRLAWLAGFILADGHIDERNRIRIEIAQKDKHLLKYICDLFQLDDSKIKNKLNNKGRINKNGKQSKLVVLILPATVGRFFIKYFHLSSQKSFGEVVFPNFLNEQCFKAYLLGLWYGDGTHYYNQKSSQRIIRFMSSFAFLTQLSQYAQENGFMSKCKPNKIRSIPTTLGYDLAEFNIYGLCGRYAPYGILFFRFLALPSIMQKIPPLDHKIKDLLTCDLPKEYNLQKWNTIEDQRLINFLKNFPIWNYKKIAKCFVDRSYQSVYGRIKTLNLDIQYPRIQP